MQKKPYWYVLNTRSRFENVVNDKLTKKSIEVFLPKIRVRSKRRDRKVIISIPLFPGYLFVKTELNPLEHIEILKTVGAVRFLGWASGPVPMPSDIIESLSIMVKADKHILVQKGFKKGDKAIVSSGPFAGVTGNFIRRRGKGRVIINVIILNNYAEIDVDEQDIEFLTDTMIS